MMNDRINVRELKASSDNGVDPEEKMFSKIDGKICKLKIKVFSTTNEVREIELKSEADLSPVISSELSEKSFSVATIKERVRMSKFSVRQRFRRMIIDYKKFAEMSKDKMTREEFVIVKGLFVSDVMNIMNMITPDVRKGKQINTLLGLSAFGKDLRVAGQELQMPYRMALNEEVNVGAPSKKRYIDIQESYNKFIDVLLRHVFGEEYKNIGINETAAALSEATSDVQPTSPAV